MTHHRYRATRALLIAGVLVTGPVLVGCADDKDVDSPPTSPTDATVSITMPTPSSSQVPNTDEITPEAAKQLCDMIRPEIDRWRGQGPTVGKVSFNGTVHNWAARNGGLNDTVVRDRSVVDAITTQNCPDVRQQALEALDIPDLASGLAGFGR
ncbi:hypothetical protein OH799_04525 [Nocardia sp. NBC_00881]|uniref:hypothetical protein n=1 Tax=Nocardia sp. NBC_00881 TaxID=2975995 RepID=UPI00386FD0F7|nr:hypothetical protein OH799_04525 [Nocardia sp. NBC_00881]